MNDNALNIISLFSGIGAFEKALTDIKQPFKILAYCDCDKDALKAYEALHFKNFIDNTTKKFEKIQSIDITSFKNTLDKNKIETDMICFGSPCNNLSNEQNKDIGFNWVCTSCNESFNPIADYDHLKLYNTCPKCKKNLDFSDDRIFNKNQSGYLFFALNFINIISPNIVMFENVPTFVKNANLKKDFNKFIDIMKSFGYRNYPFILNSKYFGIPQDRERLYCIFFKDNLTKYNNKIACSLSNFIEKNKLTKSNGTKYPCPVYLHSDEQNNIDINIYDRRETSEFLCEYTDNNRSIDCKLNKNCNFILNKPIKVATNNRSRKSSSNIFLGKGILPTLTASAGNGGNNAVQILITSSPQVHELTAQEYLLLMGFHKDDFKILKEKFPSRPSSKLPYAKTTIYKLAGNSIVVPVLKFLFSLYL